MNWVLIIVLLTLALCVIHGYCKGFLRIVYSLVAWLLALVFFVCLILIRLMVSGSWLVEGQFFLLLLIIYNRNDFERWDWRVDEREGPHTKL